MLSDVDDQHRRQMSYCYSIVTHNLSIRNVQYSYQTIIDHIVFGQEMILIYNYLIEGSIS
jgi:hypothetical protein